MNTVLAIVLGSFVFANMMLFLTLISVTYRCDRQYASFKKREKELDEMVADLGKKLDGRKDGNSVG